MPAEAKTEKKEKLPFVKKCILLILIPIVAAILVGITNMFIPNFLGLNPVKELTIYDSDSKKLLNDNVLPMKIGATYFLRGKNNKYDKKINSIFSKIIIIRNTGNKGAENIPLSVYLEDKCVDLIENPEIKTSPKGIINSLEIQKKVGSTNNKHIWNISLLNPGEAVMFEYIFYSEITTVKKCNLNILSRKKDWKVKRESILEKTKEKKTKGVDIPIIVVISIIMAFAIIGFYNFFLSSKNFQLRERIRDLLNDRMLNDKMFNDKLKKQINNEN